MKNPFVPIPLLDSFSSTHAKAFLMEVLPGRQPIWKPMKEAGIPAATVKDLVGHDSAQVSEVYTRIGRESL